MFLSFQRWQICLLVQTELMNRFLIWIQYKLAVGHQTEMINVARGILITFFSRKRSKQFNGGSWSSGLCGRKASWEGEGELSVVDEWWLMCRTFTWEIWVWSGLWLFILI